MLLQSEASHEPGREQSRPTGVLNMSNFRLRGNSAPGPFSFEGAATRAAFLFRWFEAAQISVCLFRFERIGTVTIKALIGALALAAGRQRQIHLAPAFRAYLALLFHAPVCLGKKVELTTASWPQTCGSRIIAC